MDEHQGRRFRRPRAQRTPELPTARESAETVLPDIPRVGALDALLREVDSLRLTLETDLTLAAAAVEGGAPQVAIDIIDSDRDGLRSFEDNALGHVAELARHRRRFRVPAAPFVAAAAVAGFLLGVVPHTSAPAQTDATISSNLAAENLSLLKAATSNGETDQAVEAANALHAQLLSVVAQAKTDPGAAATALALLQQEQQVLVSAGTGSPALNEALATSRQLTRLIRAVIATSAPAPTQQPAVRVVVPSSSPSPKAKPTTSPTASPKAKPTTSPTAKPSSSPQPSSSPTHGLPAAPGFS
jgi:hypothetical protein